MALYRAEVFLGTQSGIQTVEVRASTSPGAKEQICTIYHVQPTQIRNIRPVSEQSDSESSGDGSGGLALVALLVLAWLFATFTPQVLAGLFGAGSAWIATRFSAGSMEALLELRGSSRSLSIVLVVALVSGGIGWVWGDRLHNDHFRDTPKVQPK